MYVAKYFYKFLTGIVDNQTILERLRQSRSRSHLMFAKARTSPLADLPMNFTIRNLNTLSLHIDLLNSRYKELAGSYSQFFDNIRAASAVYRQ